MQTATPFTPIPDKSVKACLAWSSTNEIQPIAAWVPTKATSEAPSATEEPVSGALSAAAAVGGARLGGEVGEVVGSGALVSGNARAHEVAEALVPRRHKVMAVALKKFIFSRKNSFLEGGFR